MRKFRPSHLLPLLVIPLLLAGFNNCGISRPSVEDSSYASVGYNHTGAEVSCANCHASERPPVLNSVLHGNNADCVACHLTPVSDPAMQFATMQNTYAHTTGLASCVNCHAPNRPAPVAGFTHYNNNDCAMCHNPGTNNNTDGLTQAQVESAFLSAYAYTHPTGQMECRSCHEKNRPDPTHNPGLDCVSCHHTNNTWTSTLTDAQIQSIWNANSF